MRVGDGNAVRIDRRFRLDAEFLDGAVGQHHVDGFGFLRRGGGGGIIGRHQRAVDDAALRGAGAGAAGERLQQPRGAAGGGGGKLVVGDIDGPGALADGNAGQRRLILRIEPALRDSGRDAAPASASDQRAQAAQRPQRRLRRAGAKSCCAWSPGGRSCAMRVVECSHLSKNTRQTTVRRAFQANPRRAIGAERRDNARNLDVGGECAVYMMAEGARGTARRNRPVSRWPWTPPKP